jgi:hypothetical protein
MAVVLKGFKENKAIKITLDSSSKTCLFYYFNDAYVDEAQLLFDRVTKRGETDSLYLVYVSTSIGSYDPFFALARPRILWSGPDRYRSSICCSLGITGSPVFLVWRQGEIAYQGSSRPGALKALWGAPSPDKEAVATSPRKELQQLESPVETPLLDKETTDAEDILKTVQSYVWTLTDRVLRTLEKERDPLSYYCSEYERLHELCEDQKQRIALMQKQLQARNAFTASTTSSSPRKTIDSPRKADSPRRLKEFKPVLQHRRGFGVTKLNLFSTTCQGSSRQSS